MADENFFEKYGLELGMGEVEVGKAYPVYGMITEILESESPTDPVKCVINFNILINMIGITSDKLVTLKERAFEPGIFITQVDKFNESADNKKVFSYEGTCNTVIFGKRQEIGIQ